MSSAEDVVITPGMQAHIDRNNQYLADRSRDIREVVKKWKFDTIAVHGLGPVIRQTARSSRRARQRFPLIGVWAAAVRQN